MLEMKSKCEKCGIGLVDDGPAFICSFECTYCPDCSTAMKHVCPKCGGELVIRPRRKKKLGG